MVYRERNMLTFINLKDDEEKISFTRLKGVLLNRPSNIIYCERDGKLHGIITMGDIDRASDANKDFVMVNTQFNSVIDSEYMKVRNIFYNTSINAIPVLSGNRTLIGDWLRWDDSIPRIKCGGGVLNICTSVSHIAFVRSCNECLKGKSVFDLCYENLRMLRGVEVRCINPDEILNYIDSVDVLIFIDEDECRAYHTIYRCMDKKGYRPEKFQTYRKYVHTRMDIEYLHVIKENGVCIFNMMFEQNDYFQKMMTQVQSKFTDNKEELSSFLSPIMYEKFFGVSYTAEEAEWIAYLTQKISIKSGLGELRDYKSRFCNITDGERYTVGQPLNYTKTIYFVGPCLIYGAYVEDKNTIESFLQKKVNDSDYEIRVVNYGSPAHNNNIFMQLACILQLPLKKGDIVLLYEKNGVLHGIPEINFTNALETHNVDPGWMIDSLWHCNDKVNAIYAEAVFDRLLPLLSETVQGQGERIHHNYDVVKKMYIDRYFSQFNPSNYNQIGSIVMNCNPFTYGHRYLIEQALNTVDFLIIFVVEEDRSVFSFDERFAMVCEGVTGLESVMVVPSGPFILSQTTFPEYFIKTADEDLVENVEKDITLFAEKIAPCLNIKYRFVGEEPEDAVTNEYNMAMKRILPKNGIELVEIPRKEQSGRYISASSVRKCLEDNNMSELKKLVPESTIKILFGEMRQ